MKEATSNAAASARPLAGSIIVVTGGHGGLGRAVVARLLREGAIVHAPTRKAAEPAGDTPPGLRIATGVDLTDERAVGEFYAALPDLAASVHLAGGFAMGAIEDCARADFLRLIEQNTLTAFLCSRAAFRAFRKAGHGGRIVNVAARQALTPRMGARMAAYTASKAAVAALTAALAEEGKDDGILVNAIAPSTIDTAANRAAMPNADFSRWLAPEAAAQAIVDLVSPQNSAISGAVLPLYARA